MHARTHGGLPSRKFWNKRRAPHNGKRSHDVPHDAGGVTAILTSFTTVIDDDEGDLNCKSRTFLSSQNTAGFIFCMPRPSRATRRRTPAHSEARDNRQNATSLTKDAYMYDVYRRNSGKSKQLDPPRQWAAAASTALGSAQTRRCPAQTTNYTRKRRQTHTHIFTGKERRGEDARGIITIPGLTRAGTPALPTRETGSLPDHKTQTKLAGDATTQRPGRENVRLHHHYGSLKRVSWRANRSIGIFRPACE